MHKDWVSRWITNLDPEVKRTYAIATLLHPCFKSYDFIDDFDFIDDSDKKWALGELRTEWKFQWKPKPPTQSTADGDSEGKGTGASGGGHSLPCV